MAATRSRSRGWAAASPSTTKVAASKADAQVIVMSLGKMKPAEFFVQRGLVVYEFVGPNAAMDEMRRARKRLTSP